MENLLSVSTQVSQTLNQAIEKAWQETDVLARPQEMAAQTEVVSLSLTSFGEHAFQLYTEQGATATGLLSGAYINNYLWASQAKSYMILWRNVLFEIQKGIMLYTDGAVTAESLNKLDQDSKKTLQDAADELVGYYTKALDAAQNETAGTHRSVAAWKLQKNPWPVYSEHMEEVTRQCKTLQENFSVLSTAADAFRQIRQLSDTLIADGHSEIDRIETIGQKALAIISDYSGQPGKIAAAIEDLENLIELKNFLHHYTNRLEELLETLPEKNNTILGTRLGYLLAADVLIKKRSRHWIESEIMPLIYEIWELTEGSVNGMKMALINIRNRATLMTAEAGGANNTDVPPSDLSHPVRSFSTNLQKTKSEISLLEHLVKKRLEHSFLLSGIYVDGGEFLPVPLQSTIQQFSLGQNQWLQRGKKWINKRTKFFRDIRQTVEQEESLSTAEKIVRFINDREGEKTNTHYANIFITKGYIGESFAVGRRDELAHFGQLVENWRKGFRGSVSLTGKRFSGKSLFGELAVNRYFEGNKIRLAPNEIIRVEGRKMETSYDLAEALNFIRKNTLGDKVLVWIDDLELWWEPGIPLAQNVRSLIRFMNDHAYHIFFMISMSNWLKAHLDTFLNFNKLFQAEINLDRISAEEVRQAILIRHGATHKTLVNEDLDPLSAKAFKKITDSVYRTAKGNIGDSLSRWSGATFQVDEDRVVNRFVARYSLPDFITAETGLLLSTIMLQKRTNEYRLRKLLGPAFQERYAGLVQRLVNMGVLKRQPDDWLEVNDLLVNETGRLLGMHGYLTFEN